MGISSITVESWCESIYVQIKNIEWTFFFIFSYIIQNHFFLAAFLSSFLAALPPFPAGAASLAGTAANLSFYYFLNASKLALIYLLDE